MGTGRPSNTAVAGVAFLLAMGTLGCATKKFVRQTVAPLDVRTGDLEKKTASHDTQIEGLGKQVSAVDERAAAADSKAQDAASSAARAQQTANSAGTQATEAQNLAQKGLEKTDTVERKLTTRFEELDNYKLISSGSVLFGFNKSELTDEAKSQLGAELQKVSSLKRFVIQVEGFTDKSGAPSYNVELSRRRADAVVRHLVTSGNVPLYRVHVVGLGNSNPVADNSTRKGREENRRVEVKIFAAEAGLLSAEATRQNDKNPQTPAAAGLPNDPTSSGRD